MSDTATVFPVIIDKSAQAKATELLEREGRDDLRLRLSVQPGGCSGLIYQFYFDGRELPGDVVHDFGGFEAVIDQLSVPYLQGSLLSFADTLEAQGFQLDNPNASGTCACGDSFH
jgi:iron-sulfur cluster assembly accessory protein